MASKKSITSFDKSRNHSITSFLTKNKLSDDTSKPQPTSEKKGKFVWKSKTNIKNLTSTSSNDISKPSQRRISSDLFDNGDLDDFEMLNRDISQNNNLKQIKEPLNNIPKQVNENEIFEHDRSSNTYERNDDLESSLPSIEQSNCNFPAISQKSSPNKDKSGKMTHRSAKHSPESRARKINNSPKKSPKNSPESRAGKINDSPKKSPKKFDDKDPLRSIKLNDSGFIRDICNHPALKDIDDKKYLSKEHSDKCKDLYISLLERISEAFDRIPNCIKEKFPGYRSSTYQKIKHLKKKLKNAIETSIKDSGHDTDDFEFDSPLGTNRSNGLNSSSVLLIGENSYNTNSTAKKQLFMPPMKSSDMSTDFNRNNDRSTIVLDSSSESIVNKNKFVFKTPRASMDGPTSNSTPLQNFPSSTLDRLKSAAQTLKPIQANDENKSSVKFNNESSVQFQAPYVSKSQLIEASKSGDTVQPASSNCEDSFEDEDYAVPLDLDYMDDVVTQSDAPIDDIVLSQNIAEEKGIAIDNDGWPEYRIEDFDDTPPGLTETQDVSVMNLVDTSYVAPSSGGNYEGMGDFHDGTHNDGVTGEFDGQNYPHSTLMLETFREKFGLKSFRPNQLQVINATLLGHDCFVLMPTGGGKSLCYQLPAILTPGVTIVVSPLKSLILDQVNKLLSLDIPAAHLTGDVSLARCDEIYHSLSMKEPPIKLLYVTPEKICGSGKFQSMLDNLYSRGKIARFVIDEAHCVSQWGHDFRPDYKKLNILRQRFPNTTLMALTATANPRVRLDILHQLGVKQCKWFLSSFNRANLSYVTLEKKPKSVNKEIENYIKQNFFRQSGIVYCLSRKECETVAQDLKRANITAAAYHAGLSDKQREIVQTGWLADKYRVICATIAFGMGVDKADVRFVIHHSLPKSIEGYYQEAGRAGRDGLKSVCVLYYSYGDVVRHRRLLDMDRSCHGESKRVHLDNLLRMVELCESVSECRRASVLHYLGERFSKEACKNCMAPCDNCLRSEEFKAVDVTEECKLIVKSIKSTNVGTRAPYTLLHYADAMKGGSSQRIQTLVQTPIHGRCKSWNRGDPQRLLRQLVVRGILSEKLVVHNDIASAYLILGPNVDKLMRDNLRIVFPMKSAKPKLTTVTQSDGVKQSESTPGHQELVRLQERCYADLVEACRELGAARGASVSAVLPSAALKAMSIKLPETTEDFLAMPHVTRANYEKYGAGLLKITQQYATEKCVILMQMQDEMETDNPQDSDDDWSSKSGTSNANSDYASGGTGRFNRFKRKSTYSRANSTKKRFKRGTGKRSARGRGTSKATSSKANTPTWKSAASGSSLGAMPAPKPNTAVLNTRPGIFNNPSKLNLL